MVASPRFFLFVALLLSACQPTPAEQPSGKPATKLLFDAKEVPGSYYFGDGMGVNRHF
jgi:hypothetical protein